jgi:hypothetical protein
MSSYKSSFFYRNGLSIVFLFLMILTLGGQFITGWNEKNDELEEKGLSPIPISQYFTNGHFIQATFENWESEFLQMTLYVLLTVYLRQKGSSQSKPIDEETEVDKEPEPKPNSPWPVRKGGIWLKLYSHSLSISLFLLFLISFILHLYGSLKDHNQDKVLEGLQPDTWTSYIGQARFWFESFQNWQSEFLSIAAIVLFTVWFREKGSPESKPVDMPNDENPS